MARKSLQEDQKKAAENPDEYLGFSFDFQKALPFPKLTTSISYYKRNMYVLNLGFHNFHNNNIDMYLWGETVASRGSQEVASCCIKHLKNVTTQKHIIAYSDSCTGQNRNIKLALTWMKIVQSSENNIEILDHKFLISGHSYLPNNRDFGVIEAALKKTNVLYIPNDYYSVIAACRKKYFTVHNMEQKDFISTQSLEKSVSKRKVNTDQNTINWLKIQWIRFYHNVPYKMFYKLTLDEKDEFLTLDLSPKRGRPRRYSQIETYPLYAGPRPVSSAKYKDMMDLLNYIPPNYQSYFKNLKRDFTISEDLIIPSDDEN